MPLAARTADRLWKLSQLDPCPKLLASDVAEMSCRKLLNIAKDSFELFWQPQNYEQFAHDDPSSLRCLRGKEPGPLLCVRYIGRRDKRTQRVRPSDIVRCELQCRRRLLELLGPESKEAASGVASGPADTNTLVIAPVEIPALSEPKAGPAARAARAQAALDRIPNVSRDPSTMETFGGMDLVDALKEEPWYRGQVVHVNQTGARKAIFLEPKVALQPVLKEVLNRSLLSGSSSSSASQSGVLKLYSHQAEAIDAILLERRDVIVSTSTGSGKSLIYMIAIFEALLKEEDATAILIFPTKALAQDQLRALTDVADALIQLGVPKEKLTFATLDGDTPQKERQKIRRETRVVLTNPDPHQNPATVCY